MNKTQYTCHRMTFNLLSTASLAFDCFLLPLEVWGLSGMACLQDERLGSDVGGEYVSTDGEAGTSKRWGEGVHAYLHQWGVWD